MSRYADVYKNRSGPGDARPTALQIVEDLNLVGKLQGKTAIVTGVSAGIGIETMRSLYVAGLHVFGTARDLAKAQKVVDEIEKTNQGGKITLIEMHLDSLASVKKGADEILKLSNSQINLLINSAGVMACPYAKTKDGFETQFGVDYLAHFYLFELLKDALLKSATPDYPSRVVNVSSTGHRVSGIRFDDINFDKGGYEPFLAYGQAKTANIYFTNELERRYGSKNLHSTSLHPGRILTELGRHLSPEVLASFTADAEMWKAMENPNQGAATSVYAALSPEWANKGGKYLADCVEQGSIPDGVDFTYLESDGYSAHAYKPEDEKRLWTESLRWLGVHDDQ